MLRAVVLWEGDLEGFLLVGGEPREGILETRDHAAGTEHDLRTFSAAPLEGFGIIRDVSIVVSKVAREIELHLIAIGRSTSVLYLEGLPLLAQALDHVVDVAFGQLRDRLGDLDGRQITEFDFGKDLERCGELERFFRVERCGLKRRWPSRSQRLALHCLEEAGLHDFPGDLLAYAGAEASLDFSQRDFPGAKSGQPHLLGGLLEARGHLGLEAVRREANGHAPLEARRRLDRYVHGLLVSGKEAHARRRYS